MWCPDMGQEICLSWVMEKETQVGVKCERINRETIFPEWIRSMRRHLLNYSLENKRHFFKKKSTDHFGKYKDECQWGC